MNSDFILIKLQLGDKDAFDFIFKEYYKNLVWFAFDFIQDKYIAEEFVQGVYVKLWEEREKIVIVTSLKAYLYKSVQNKCLDYIKHGKIKHRYEQMVQKKASDISSENAFFSFELKEKIDEAIEHLPAKTKEIFKLNRYGNKKYKEIAELLSISVKTVEAHIGKALSALRLELKDWL